jgi:ribulose-phosphate 3-epimerase
MIDSVQTNKDFRPVWPVWPVRPVQISPSLLSSDFSNIARDVKMIEQGTPEWLHVDVMDGHFVANLTIGPPMIKALKKITDVPLDVHLMIDNPLRQLDWYLDAGADLLTFHIECAGETLQPPETPGQSITATELKNPQLIDQLITQVHTARRKIGIALNPGTSTDLVLPFLNRIDLVMIMGVHPGFGGQSLVDGTLVKIAHIADMAKTNDLDLLVEIDGGINIDNVSQAASAGANIIVAGNAIFGSSDPLAALVGLRRTANDSHVESLHVNGAPAHNTHIGSANKQQSISDSSSPQK